MLIWQKIRNNLERIGFERAAAQLVSQGKYSLAASLRNYGRKRTQERSQAIHRLERVLKCKSNYEPGDHYMKGHSVAFWRGHAKGL